MGLHLDMGSQVFLLLLRWKNAIEDLSQAAGTAVQIRAISKLLFSLCCDTITKISLLLAPVWRDWSLKAKVSVTVGKGPCAFKARYGGSYSSLLYFYSQYYFLCCLTACRCLKGLFRLQQIKCFFFISYSKTLRKRQASSHACGQHPADDIYYLNINDWHENW